MSHFLCEKANLLAFSFVQLFRIKLCTVFEDESLFVRESKFTCILLCAVVSHLCCHRSFSCPESICWHMSRRRIRTMGEMHGGCKASYNRSSYPLRFHH